MAQFEPLIQDAVAAVQEALQLPNQALDLLSDTADNIIDCVTGPLPQNLQNALAKALLSFAKKILRREPIPGAAPECDDDEPATNATCAAVCDGERPHCPCGYEAYLPDDPKDPVPNGCGSEAMAKLGLNALGAKLMPPVFQGCCHEHDVCYSTFGTLRSGCDLDFRDCLHNVSEGEADHFMADTFYNAVKYGGQGPYCGGQTGLPVLCRKVEDVAPENCTDVGRLPGIGVPPGPWGLPLKRAGGGGSRAFKGGGVNRAPQN